MEKVKVTQEQAEAIERWADKDQLLIARATGLLNHGEDESIAELEINTLAKALYIGYEVEPEFKVGDWVYHDNDHVGIVTEIKDGVITIDKKLGYKRGDGTDAYVNSRAKYYRHATPSEIAEEKERRIKKKLGKLISELTQEEIKKLKTILTWEYASDGSSLRRLDVKTNE